MFNTIKSALTALLFITKWIAGIWAAVLQEPLIAMINAIKNKELRDCEELNKKNNKE